MNIPDNTQEEQWLPVPSMETFYLVSSNGRVFSLPQASAPGRYARKGRYLAPGVSSCGYRVCKLNGGGRRVTVSVHKLVAAAFLGKKPAGSVVTHLNGDRLDNRAANLAYRTQKENLADRYEHGTYRPACRVKARRPFSPADKVYIEKELADGRTPHAIAGVLGRCKSSLYTWVHNNTSYRGGFTEASTGAL